VISGAVVANRGPVVPLVVLDGNGRQHAISALVDTGFNGWLTLPAKLIVALGLSWYTQGQGILADGGTTLLDVFTAHVLWDGQQIPAFVSELEGDPLIGMRLLSGFRLSVDAIDGGTVRIERLR
jgi:clan AA aspartic protease